MGSPAFPSTAPRQIHEAAKAMRRARSAAATTGADLAEHEHDDSARLTVSATVPTLAGKVAGRDFLYLDTGTASTSRIGFVTGASGGIVEDDFDREDGALGTAPTGQAWTTAAGGPSISGQTAVKNVSGAFVSVPVGAPLHYARADVTLASVASGSQVAASIRVGALSDLTAGVEVSMFFLGPGLYINYSLPGGGGAGTYGPIITPLAAFSAGQVLRFEANMTSTTQIVATVTNLNTGVTGSIAIPPSPVALTGTYVAVALDDDGASFDNFYGEALGTLAWEYPQYSILPLTTKTANYTLTLDDRVVVANGTSLTITLPSAVTAGSGAQFVVKNIHSTAATVGSTAGTIDGAASQNLAQWDALTVVSNGSDWLMV